MLGPGDLRLSLGLPSRKIGELDDPKFLAAIDRLVDVSQRHRKPLMTVSFKVSAKDDTWITRFNLLLVSADFVNVVQGHLKDLETAKNVIGEILEAQKGSDKSNGIVNRHSIVNGTELET